MKKINLITKVGVDFGSIVGDQAIKEVIKIVDGVGHDDIPFYMDWEDVEENSAFKKFLVDTYGDEIKNHEEFILLSC